MHTYSKGQGPTDHHHPFLYSTWGEKKHTKEQIFTLIFNDERKNSKKSISWYEIISQYDMIVQYEMISQYEIQISKKRKKFFLNKFKFLWSFYQNSQSNACLQVACGCFCMQQQRWLAVTETAHPTNSEVLILCPLQACLQTSPGREHTELDGEKKQKMRHRKNAKMSMLPPFDPQQGRAGQRSDFMSLLRTLWTLDLKILTN